jgi:hypothetical protein
VTQAVAHDLIHPCIDPDLSDIEPNAEHSFYAIPRYTPPPPRITALDPYYNQENDTRVLIMTTTKKLASTVHSTLGAAVVDWATSTVAPPIRRYLHRYQCSISLVCIQSREWSRRRGSAP